MQAWMSAVKSIHLVNVLCPLKYDYTCSAYFLNLNFFENSLKLVLGWLINAYV